MDGWNTTFLLGRPIFRAYVSFREDNFLTFFWLIFLLEEWWRSFQPPEKESRIFNGGECVSRLQTLGLFIQDLGDVSNIFTLSLGFHDPIWLAHIFQLGGEKPPPRRWLKLEDVLMVSKLEPSHESPISGQVPSCRGCVGRAVQGRLCTFWPWLFTRVHEDGWGARKSGRIIVLSPLMTGWSLLEVSFNAFPLQLGSYLYYCIRC